LDRRPERPLRGSLGCRGHQSNALCRRRTGQACTRRYPRSCTTAIGTLKQHTRSIPLVFVVVNDPVAQGFVSSVAHPGGNGAAIVEASDAHARTAVGFMFNPRYLESLVGHHEQVGFDVTPLRVRSEADIAQEFLGTLVIVVTSEGLVRVDDRKSRGAGGDCENYALFCARKRPRSRHGTRGRVAQFALHAVTGSSTPARLRYRRLCYEGRRRSLTSDKAT
jgi:hypothetical protein